MIPLSGEISLQWPCEENHLQLLRRTEAARKRSVYVVPFPLPLFIFPLIYLCVCLCYVTTPSLRHSLCCCFYQFCCLVPPLPLFFFYHVEIVNSCLTDPGPLPDNIYEVYKKYLLLTPPLHRLVGGLQNTRLHVESAPYCHQTSSHLQNPVSLPAAVASAAFGGVQNSCRETAI